MLLKITGWQKYLLLLLLTPLIVSSQQFFSLVKSKNENIIVDGIFSDGEWSNATIIPLEVEIEPANNELSKKKTLAYVTYSDDAILIGIHAFDDPKNIRASVHSRDSRNFWRDDVVNVRFDTYRDSRNNYVMAVNPLGSQFDLLLENTNNRRAINTNFNINYETAGSLVADGYQVEIRIPFSELPFPNGKDQIWNMRINRAYFENGIRVETSSQEFDRDNLCVTCQTTDAIELRDIKIEKRREILPYFFSSFSGLKQTPNSKMNYGDIFGRSGLGINLEFNKTTLLEGTLNPDFSQVEADVTLIDVNSPRSLRYPERRPFFNRGMDIVRFSQDIFYSRSIVSPIFTSKLLSQGKKSRFFALTALDMNSKYVIGGEDKTVSADLGKTYSGMIRYQKISKKTRFGFLSSNRFYEIDGYGSLLGLDGLIDLNNSWRFSFEIFKNFNLEPISNAIDNDDIRYGRSLNLDGEFFQGHSIDLNIRRSTEHFKNVLYYREVSPNHQSDLGFITRTNRRLISFTNTYNNIIDRDFVRQFGFELDIDAQKNFNNELNLISINLKGEVSIRGNSSIEYDYDLDTFKNYLGYDFKNTGISKLSLSSSPSELINFSALLEWGKEIAFNEKVPEIGRLFSTSFSIRLQLNNNFSVTPSIRSSNLENLEDGSDYFDGSIMRIRTVYQFNNFLNIRIISERNTFNDNFFIQPLIQWTPNPSTIFYLGGNQQTLAFEDEEFGHPELFDFNRNQFFLKFQYLIGL